MAKPIVINQASSFWLDKKMFNPDGETSSISKHLKLLAYKRSISNFVKLLTGKEYKVMFSSGDQSYTDGNTVVISSKLNENNFDVTVGLALHEASHILLTDFKVLKRIDIYAADELGHLALDLRRSDLDYIHRLHNIVEDRYIDNFVYTNAPGYRGYYNSLYDFYFRKKSLTEWLKKPANRKETFDNYLNQFLNIIGLNFDINCMPAMTKIVSELDIVNINRLTTTEDRLRVALRIYKIIKDRINLVLAAPAPIQPILPESDLESYDEPTQQNKPEPSQDANLDNAPLSSPDDNEKETKEKEQQSGPEEEKVEEEDNGTIPADISEILGNMKEFAEGKLSKDGSASTKLNRTVEALDKADAQEHISVFAGNNVKTLLVKNVTIDIIQADLFPNLFFYPKSRSNTYTGTEGIRTAINKGILMGKQLSGRMQVRNEEKTTITNRLNSGKILNRHVAMLGADVENIFYKTRTDKFKTSTIHLSIDASGSMSGSRFNNSIQLATAIAKACTSLRGVNCIISFRSVQERMPLMLIAYNSKTDHFSKIPTLFPYLTANSSTPEGLCYDAYLKFIQESDNNDVDRYVINLSDGEPGHTIPGCKIGYQGLPAVEHTKQTWNKILKMGVTGMSYFINENPGLDVSKTFFGKMYGKGAKRIDSDNLPQLARTVNDMLMSTNAVNSVLSE